MEKELKKALQDFNKQSPEFAKMELQLENFIREVVKQDDFLSHRSISPTEQRQQGEYL